MKRTISGDGVTLAARESVSSGPTVVLLHGLGAHQRSWNRVAGELKDFHLVSFDYRGHGRSGTSDGYTIDALLLDLARVISALNLETYVLLGHSIGADLALLSASKDAGCRGVVLVDGALISSPPETEWERYAVMEGRFIFKTLMFLGRLFGTVPHMSIADIRSLTEDLERRRDGFGERLASLDVPAMYVVGDQADKVPDGERIHLDKMTAVREMSSTYDVRVEYLPSGHLVPMVQPKRLGRLIKGFVHSVSA